MTYRPLAKRMIRCCTLQILYTNHNRGSAVKPYEALYEAPLTRKISLINESADLHKNMF